MPETVDYDTSILHYSGVRVLPDRARFGRTEIPLEDVVRVDVGRVRAPRGIAYAIAAVGVGLILGGIWSTDAAYVSFGIVVGTIGGLAAYWIRDSFTVRIVRSEGEMDAWRSTERELVERIVISMRAAMAHREDLLAAAPRRT